jgi:hypothetical protein
MTKMYTENKVINAKDRYNPIDLILLVHKHAAIAISIKGINQDTNPAIGVSKGDCPNCTTKVSWSNTLLAAA